MHNIASAKLKGSIPISIRRTTVSAALLVCSVLKTRCPVKDASTPIEAVSWSLISPTIITSGSALRNARMALAKSSSIFGFTSSWRRPSCVISTGSSAVQIFLAGVFMYPRAECSVVVLPEPVGPTTSTIP